MLLPAEILEPDFSQKSRKQELPHQIDILTSDLRAPMGASHGFSQPCSVLYLFDSLAMWNLMKDDLKPQVLFGVVTTTRRLSFFL